MSGYSIYSTVPFSLINCMYNDQLEYVYVHSSYPVYASNSESLSSTTLLVGSWEYLTGTSDSVESDSVILSLFLPHCK